MIISNDVRIAIDKACQSQKGGAAFLAKCAGFTPSQIARYRKGSISTISDKCWSRLFPHVFQFLPDGFTCQVLVDGELRQRTVRKSTETKTTSVWKNEEYFRLFGTELPTKEKIRALLQNKIMDYKDDFKLLYLLLSFDRVMDSLLSNYAGITPEMEKRLDDKTVDS